MLFKVENGVVKPLPETLAIWPYSQINERDETTHKERATQDWKFIEFYCSPKKENPFFGYPKGEIRAVKLIENIKKVLPEYQIDDLIKEAIDQYEEFWHNASPQLSYYESTLVAAKKIEDFFNNFDMREKNIKSGAPIYKPKEITTALADTKAVLASLNAIKEQVYQEIYDQAKSKAGRQVNPFER